MNHSPTNCGAVDTSALTGSGTHRITLSVSQLGHVPSFKNAKQMRSWMDKASRREEFRNGEWWVAKRSIKLRSTLITDPAIQKWMEEVTCRFVSQLRCALAIIAGVTQTAASQRLLIASLLPRDDCWTSYREVVVKSSLCEKGQEGATITIEVMSPSDLCPKK